GLPQEVGALDVPQEGEPPDWAETAGRPRSAPLEAPCWPLEPPQEFTACWLFPQGSGVEEFFTMTLPVSLPTTFTRTSRPAPPQRQRDVPQSPRPAVQGFRPAMSARLCVRGRRQRAHHLLVLKRLDDDERALGRIPGAFSPSAPHYFR